MAEKIRQPIRTIPKVAPRVQAPAPKVAPKVAPRVQAEKKAAPKPKVAAPAPVEDEVLDVVATPAQDEANVIDIPMDQITFVPDKFRTESEKVEEEQIRTMAHSIRDVGLLQYPVVNALEDGSFELISGRRRVKACDMLEWETVPCIVKNYDKLHSEMATLTENIIRDAYTRASYDKAVARWGTLYEQMHPESKAKAAGGHAKARATAAKTGKKVSSSKPAKSFTRVVAEKTGMSPRQVQQTRKRGSTFTDDDDTVFKAKGIKIADQNMVAAISDVKKRQGVIKMIADGVPFQEAYDHFMLPEGATRDSVAGNLQANGGMPMSDEEWLSQCPIRSKVVKPLFDAHALVYRRTLDAKQKLERAFNTARKEFKGQISGKHGYPMQLSRLIKAKHPKEWQICGTCAGKGSVKSEVVKGEVSPCSSCDQCGFIAS